MDVTRLFIEVAVDKALVDILRDPQRSVRNTVDLARSFSTGRFQSRFLASAQRLLRHQNSAYYALAKQIAAQVDPMALKSFGINLGYNGFTRGAKSIRRFEAEQRVNIPWAIAIEYDGQSGLTTADIDNLITNGKALGIYAYFIAARTQDIAPLGQVAMAHGDCAFVLLMPPGPVDPQALSTLASENHVVLSLPAEDPAYEALAASLRQQRRLFTAHARYTDDDYARLLDPAWLDPVLPSGCTFVLFVADRACSEAAQAKVHDYVLRVRKEQQRPIFLMDLFTDALFIDEVISEQACNVSVQADGRVYSRNPLRITAENVRDSALEDILRRTMPRVAYI